MNDTLISFGGEVKALGDGKFGGYLVRYSSAEAKDLEGDFFDKDTDFGFTGEIKSPVYFNHRLPLKTKDGKQVVVKSKIGEATLKLDDEGVLIDAILYNRDKYEKAIIAAGKAKKLGWSSGTAKHLVDREDNGHIKKWPLGLDASTTPIPCEPQNDVVEAKSFDSVKFAPLDEVLVIDADEVAGIDVKGIFADALAEYDRQTWELWSALGRAAKDIVDAARSSNITGVTVDVAATVRQLVDEYAAELAPEITRQINEYLASDNIENFYLKTVFDEMNDARAASKVSDHLELVLAAAQEVQTRMKLLHDLRVKSGRVLSEANRTRLTNLLTGLQSCAGDIDTLLKDTAPVEKSIDPDVARGLVIGFELQKMRMPSIV